MSKELDRLLNANHEGGIKDYEQIADIISNLLDSKASYITNFIDPNKKGAFKAIIDNCHLIPLCRDHILFKELLSLLFHADLFEDLGTPAEDDDSIDFYAYPYFLTFSLLCNLLNSEKYVPEVAQFLNINFYKFSQHMTNLISKTNKERSAHICGHLMHQLQLVSGLTAPPNDATVRDIFNMLRQNFRPFYPGVEDINTYQERIMAICLAAWDMLVVYANLAYGFSHRTSAYNIIKKYGDQDFYHEFDEFYNAFSVETFAMKTRVSKS